MFISCFDPEKMIRMVNEAGFDIIEKAIETQMERGVKIPDLWIYARKQ